MSKNALQMTKSPWNDNVSLWRIREIRLRTNRPGQLCVSSTPWANELFFLRSEASEPLSSLTATEHVSSLSLSLFLLRPNRIFSSFEQIYTHVLSSSCRMNLDARATNLNRLVLSLVDERKRKLDWTDDRCPDVWLRSETRTTTKTSCPTMRRIDGCSSSRRRHFGKSPTLCESTREQPVNADDTPPCRTMTNARVDQSRQLSTGEPTPGKGSNSSLRISFDCQSLDSDDQRQASPNLLQKLLFRQFSPKTRPYSTNPQVNPSSSVHRSSWSSS